MYKGPARCDCPFCDAYFLVDRAARLIFTGVQTGIGHPLAHVEISRRNGRLGQQAQGAGRPMLCGEEQVIGTVPTAGPVPGCVRLPGQPREARWIERTLVASPVRNRRRKATDKGCGVQAILSPPCLLGESSRRRVTAHSASSVQKERPKLERHARRKLPQHLASSRHSCYAASAPRRSAAPRVVGHHDFRSAHLGARIARSRPVQARGLQRDAHGVRATGGDIARRAACPSAVFGNERKRSARPSRLNATTSSWALTSIPQDRLVHHCLVE